MTGNAVQLNGFFRKTFYFYNLFSQSATLPVYLFLYLSMYVLYHTIFQPSIFSVQGFSLNFARTLGRAVDKLLNGSRVNSHGQFIFGKQSLSLFRGNTAFQQNRRCNFAYFLDMVKTTLHFRAGVFPEQRPVIEPMSKLDCSLLFFRKCVLLTVKIVS